MDKAQGGNQKCIKPCRMDLRKLIVITVILCALPSTFVAAPFQQAKNSNLNLKSYWQNELLSGKAAIQEVDLSPEEQKERDKTLCNLLMYGFKFVFHLNLPMNEKFCEAFREHEKPDASHQKMLYDFILKHLNTLGFE